VGGEPLAERSGVDLHDGARMRLNLRCVHIWLRRAKTTKIKVPALMSHAR
jgi:hypothetical protein